MIFIVLLNMKKHKFLIPQLINQEMDFIFYLDGKAFAMIKMLMVKQQTYFVQEKQTAQPIIKEQGAYLRSVIDSCIQRHKSSFERTDFIQITKNTFYYKRFSISTNDSPKSMGHYRVQMSLEDTLGVRDTKYLEMIDKVIHQLIGR